MFKKCLSNIDGVFSTDCNFQGSISIGHHIITLRVKDENGIWSKPSMDYSYGELYVYPIPIVVVDDGTLPLRTFVLS